MDPAATGNASFLGVSPHLKGIQQMAIQLLPSQYPEFETVFPLRIYRSS
jgi:hypothetical protein